MPRTHHTQHPWSRGFSLAVMRSLEVLCRPAVTKRHQRRGVAILMVVAYIAIMSALVVSSFYSNQVSYSISSNARDNLKAYYKARSALNLTRLMLAFQYELEQDEFFRDALRKSNFQIYQITDLLLEPFKTGALSLSTDESSLIEYDLQGSGTSGLGDDSGDYTVEVFPEEGRININKFAEGLDQVALYELCMLVMGEQYDTLFDTADDPNRVKDERREVISAIIDWADPDTERTNLTTECQLEGASGDEDGRYDRLRSRRRYKTKNAKYTTVDELFMVHGVTDDFMAAFRDSLTVYPVGRINVNIAPARVIYALLCGAVQLPQNQFGQSQWACADPATSLAVLTLAVGIEGYQQFVSNPLLLLSYYMQGNPQVIDGVTKAGTVVPFRNPTEFKRVLDAMRVDANVMNQFLVNSPTFFQMNLNPDQLIGAMTIAATLNFEDRKIFTNITTDGPRIFRITAHGDYNGTRKTLTAVVDFRSPGGRFLYWREN